MSGLNNLQTRLNFYGGKTQTDRLKKAKANSLLGAIGKAYQTAHIEFQGEEREGLMNPDVLTGDYDNKILSLPYPTDTEAPMLQLGDTFLWKETNTHWIVFLQVLTELAYFKAHVRRCTDYIDLDGHKYWIHLKGPHSLKLQWLHVKDTVINELNESLVMYITKNEETVDLFKRLEIITIEGNNWRVAGTNKYFGDGIMEVFLEEYHNDLPQNVEIIEMNHVEDESTELAIEGPKQAKVYSTVTYAIANKPEDTTGTWFIVQNGTETAYSSNDSIKLDILNKKNKQFKLIYRCSNGADAELTVDIIPG